MSLGRSQVADRDADGKRPAQTRVREEHVAGAVDEIDETLVCGIELRVRERHIGWLPPEADDAERDGRKPFEIRMRVDPRGELPREIDVRGEDFTNAARADCAQD